MSIIVIHHSYIGYIWLEFKIKCAPAKKSQTKQFRSFYTSKVNGLRIIPSAEGDIQDKRDISIILRNT